MKEILEYINIIQNGGGAAGVITSIVTLGAFAFLCIKFVQTVYGWFMWCYRKRRGIETKEERLAKIEERLLAHESDMEKIRDKESDDIKEIKEMLTDLTRGFTSYQEEQREQAKREEQFNRVVMRNTILSGVNDLREAEWACSPATKQNMDELFECYFANHGNGEIKMLKETEYDKNIHVDFSLL